MDHEAIGELHRLGTSSTELAGDDDFATFGTRFHNESEDTIASTLTRCSFSAPRSDQTGDSPTNSQTTKQFVSQALALGDSRKTTVLNLFSVEFEGIFGEFESFLDEGGEFANASALLTEDLLGEGGPDDDLDCASTQILET